MATISVIGSGGWGTALAVMATRGGHRVTLWSRFEEEIRAIRDHGENRPLLPGVPVSPSVSLTTDLGEATAGADLILLAVPSFAIGETCDGLAAVLPDGALIANCGKGLDDKTYRRFSEVIAEKLPRARVTVLSGPSHAEEVGRNLPTTVVCASRDVAAAERVQELLMSPRFRIYVSDDTVGVELGGALKNVIALAAGIVDGLQIGDNAKAALMTRGLAEIARLGGALGAQLSTFSGLSGVGDLIVTCGSLHSRNHRAGVLIGQGIEPAEAVRQVGTVEGYFAVRTAHALAEREGVEMPIVEQCYRVCCEGVSPLDAVGALMGRPKKHETESRWA